MPSTQQPNCQRSNQAEPAETGLNPACYSGEIARFTERFLTNSNPTWLKVEQSGKGRIYSSSQPSSTPPTKKSQLFFNRLDLGFRKGSHPRVMRRAVIPSYGSNYMNFENAGKGSFPKFSGLAVKGFNCRGICGSRSDSRA